MRIFWLGIAALVAVFLLAPKVFAHDTSMARTSEERQVYEFYARWMRPKGRFEGMTHRAASCCNKTDCFPVEEIRKVAGTYFVRVRTPNGLSPEYKVDASIIEANQRDPRESPDGRSHACIIGGMVVCFVEGSGI